MMEIWKLMWRSATSTPFSVGPKNSNKNPVSNTNSGIMQKISKWPKHWLLTVLWSCATLPTGFPTNRDLRRIPGHPGIPRQTVTLFERQKWQKAAQLSSLDGPHYSQHRRWSIIQGKVFDQEALEERRQSYTKQHLRHCVSRANSALLQKLEMETSIRQEARHLPAEELGKHLGIQKDCEAVWGIKQQFSPGHLHVPWSGSALVRRGKHTHNRS